MKSRILIIAAHEYITNVRRKEFILITLGLPVMMLVFTTISAVGAGVVVSQMLSSRTQRVGVVDGSHALALDYKDSGTRNIILVKYQSPDAAKDAVRRDALTAVMIVSPDYLHTGAVEVFRKGGGFFGSRDTIPVGRILARGLLAKSGAKPLTISRAVEPTGTGAVTYTWNERTRQFSRRTGTADAAKFLVPYLFTILLFTSIFISANYLLRGIADEKENRVIEVILSSVSPDDLLKGKLIGLAGVGLTQVGVWMLMSVVPASVMFSKVVHLSAGTLVWVAVYFALGFGLYATLMAGIGSLGTSYRETQQISGSVSMLAIAPLLLMTVLIEFPNGALAKVLSYIPFTGPTTMILRITSADVPALDYVISSASVILGIWLVLKLSTKLFRFGLLIYGKRPTFGETVKWLRQA
jgi:ABC-2 type transport system permease protein